VVFCVWLCSLSMVDRGKLHHLKSLTESMVEP
jgi:hypothetical protein